VARRTEAVAPLAALGSALDIEVTAARFGSTPAARVDVTVSTLPGGTDLGAAAAPLAQHGGLLVDVVYGGWPTALAEAWVAAGSAAVSGLPMLLHQALLQVRVFVAGDPARPVQSEPAVLAAMRRALVGD
jgi:shikimate dehydrogenase